MSTGRYHADAEIAVFLGEGCGARMRDVNGTFASPNYPGQVTTGFTCRWDIHVPARRSVNLRLTVLVPAVSPGTSDDTADEGCGSSLVEVYVYSSAGSPRMRLLGRYCTTVSTQQNCFTVSRSFSGFSRPHYGFCLSACLSVCYVCLSATVLTLDDLIAVR